MHIGSFLLHANVRERSGRQVYGGVGEQFHFIPVMQYALNDCPRALMQ